MLKTCRSTDHDDEMLRSIPNHRPYAVVREGARAQWFVVMDLRTGKASRRFMTYLEAATAIQFLKLNDLLCA